mgnify:CR=1 FL=1
MSKYRTCPRCGSNLDYGETCDCTQAEEKEPQDVEAQEEKRYEAAS